MSDTCVHRQTKVSKASKDFQMLMLKHYEEVPLFQVSWKSWKIRVFLQDLDHY